MMTLSYKKLNNYLGIFVFILSSICYLLTIERGISFWDTGEYIASAAKLEVTHSPGAAFFQLLGAVFSGLAFGDGTKYAILINSMNAILSGATVMLTFWVITHFMQRILMVKNPELDIETKSSKIVLFTAGLIGALCWAFSDTFWYSAVEGEVYAMASTFIALIIWIVTKYDREEDKSYENRWLLLIAFLLGISVGVHMMVLLAVPAVCFIYYNKNYEFNIRNFVIANVITLLVLGLVFRYIFPSFMKLFGEAEIFFINEIGLPFNSGSIIAFVFIAVVFYFIFKYTSEYKLVNVNTAFWGLLFMLIGFSCWTMIPVRANANPPMNLNNPDNALSLRDYYNREQYGDWPTIYGANYTAYLDQGGLTKQVDTSPIYLKNEDSGVYEVVGSHFAYEFDPKHESLFPRMYFPSNETGVQDNYAMRWGYPKFKIKSSVSMDPQAQQKVEELRNKVELNEASIDDYASINDLIDIQPPTLGQNLSYFADYQIGQMYVRYLLWNFAGKQNDKEWQYDEFYGNWEDGIIRNSKRDLPSNFTDKGTNHYFFLPLILGLIGLFFQLNRDFPRFYALLSLFLLAGIGIIIYTNVKPFEPRERDYALVGSFWVFALWIGLGAGAIMEFLQSKLKNQNLLGGATLLLLFVPILMAFQNWDDHDRSRRHTAYDEAYSYLKPLGEKSMVIVYGDNDTYPLWGVQETEGLRDDVKVVNNTLLGTSWYINQVHRKTYTADALPHSLNENQYREGVNDLVYVIGSDLFQLIFNSEQSDMIWNDAMQSGYSRATFADLEPFATRDSMTAKEAIDYLKEYKQKPERAQFLKFINENFIRSSSNNFEAFNLLPVNKIVIPVNKENCIKYGIVRPEDADKMLDHVTLNIASSSLNKANLAMLDMLANYNWDRPLYFSAGGVMDPYGTFFMNEYTQYLGFVYKFVPIHTPIDNERQYGRVNGDEIYDYIKEFRWGNFKDPKAHFDETGLRNILTYRRATSRAAVALASEGKNQKAKELLDICNEEIPFERYSTQPGVDDLIYAYMVVGEEKKALEMAQKYQDIIMQQYAFYDEAPPLLKQRQGYQISRLVNNYSLSAKSIIKGYLYHNQNEKAISYSNDIMNKWYKKFDQIIADVETTGEKGYENNKSDVSDILRISGIITSSFANSVDSTYVMEKSLELQMKIEKLYRAAGLQ